MIRRIALFLKLCRNAGTAAVLALAALPACAWAADEDHGNPWMDLAWKTINLIVLVAIIWYFARKPMRTAFRSMAKQAFEKWTGAHQAAKTAQTEVAAQRKQIEGLEQELARMVADARVDADRESARLVALARAEADRILAAARAQAEQEVAKARTELQRQIAEDTVRLAAEMIRDKATPEQRRKLVDGYIREMEARQ
jgi:F-type H+-transporting ATPase subunit b